MAPISDGSTNARMGINPTSIPPISWIQILRTQVDLIHPQETVLHGMGYL